MRLTSWNVNGIRAAAKGGLIRWFRKEQPDVLCLQEIKADADQVDPELAAPAGYHVYWNSAEKRGYSGVAMFTRVKPAEVTFGLDVPEFDREGRVITARFGGFTLINVYVPNGRRDHKRVPFKLQFSDALLEYSEDLRRNGEKVVLCGDFNTAHREIDLRYPAANRKTTGFLPRERAWIDKFLAYGYLDTFRHFVPDGGHYTWWTYRVNARERNIGWRIDYFFMVNEMKPALRDAYILSDVTGSDHCPIGIEIDTTAL